MSNFDIVGSLSLDTKDFERKLKTASERVGDMAKKVHGGAASFAKYGSAAAAAGAAMAAHFTAKQMEAIDAQAKLAQKLNTTISSLQSLERAGNLSGVTMAEISTASRQLAVRLGDAQIKGGQAAEALDRLGLSAKQLASVPLDQRILLINQAIQNNIPVSERASVAAELFGARAATAIKQLSPEVLAQARKEVERFGVALSDVDAAKIEAANDAMSTFGLVTQGVFSQIAVQASPILTALSNQLLGVAEDGNTMAKAVENAFNFMIKGAGFVLNAVDGIKRVFSVVADGIIIAYNKLFEMVAAKVASLLKLLDKVPGLDFTEAIGSVESFGQVASGVIQEAMGNIGETVLAPMASEKFEEFIVKAREAGQTAAEAAVEARQAVLGESGQSEEAETEQVEKEKEKEQERTASLAQQYQDRFNILNNLAKQRYGEQGEIAADSFRSIISTATGGSKKLHKLTQKLGIAEATINMFRGISVGVSKGFAGIPEILWATATGLKQIQAIKSTNLGGGGGAAGGASSSAGGGGSAGQQGGQGSLGSIQLVGLDPGSLISSDSIVEAFNIAKERGVPLSI